MFRKRNAQPRIAGLVAIVVAATMAMASCDPQSPDPVTPVGSDTIFFSPSVIPSTMDTTAGSIVQFHAPVTSRFRWVWTSSDTAVAWVHRDSGWVLAKKTGQAMIIVRDSAEARIQGGAVLRVR